MLLLLLQLPQLLLSWRTNMAAVVLVSQALSAVVVVVVVVVVKRIHSLTAPKTSSIITCVRASERERVPT